MALQGDCPADTGLSNDVPLIEPSASHYNEEEKHF